MTEGFIALVKTKTNITDIIGTDPYRIFPVMIPQGLTTFPSIAYRIVNIDHNNTFDGGSTYDFVYIDIFVYARTIDSVRDLFDVFRSEIEDSTGTYAGYEFDHVWFVGGGDEDYIDETDLYIKRMELKIGVQR